MILKEYVEQISMLNALIKVSEKILIFCEGGQIKKPTAHSPLMLLLDQMVIPVTLPGKTGRGRFPAFHPKTWVLQYRNAYDEIEAEENISYTVTEPITKSLTITNTGTVPVKWQIDTSDPLLQVSSTSGFLEIGESCTINVTIQTFMINEDNGIALGSESLIVSCIADRKE